MLACRQRHAAVTSRCQAMSSLTNNNFRLLATRLTKAEANPSHKRGYCMDWSVMGATLPESREQREIDQSATLKACTSSELSGDRVTNSIKLSCHLPTSTFAPMSRSKPVATLLHHDAQQKPNWVVVVYLAGFLKPLLIKLVGTTNEATILLCDSNRRASPGAFNGIAERNFSICQ